MNRNKESEKLIESFENRKLVAYLCSAGIPTIGIGTTKYPNGVKVKLGDICTNEQAVEWLQWHLKLKVYPQLVVYSWVPDKVYVALASFVYNCGNVGYSLRVALEQKNWVKLSVAFKKYIYSNGQISNGLINRRNAEVKYFMGEV